MNPFKSLVEKFNSQSSVKKGAMAGAAVALVPVIALHAPFLATTAVCAGGGAFLWRKIRGF